MSLLIPESWQSSRRGHVCGSNGTRASRSWDGDFLLRRVSHNVIILFSGLTYKDISVELINDDHVLQPDGGPLGLRDQEQGLLQLAHQSQPAGVRGPRLVGRYLDF